MYNVSLIGIITMKPSAYHEYILIKIYLKKKENWGLGGKGVRESNGRV
jgi:hypothetical protein